LDGGNGRDAVPHEPKEPLLLRSQSEPIHILFVRTGNICRSPMAEGIFRQIVHAQRVQRYFVVDSAATMGDYAGYTPHPKAQAAMRARGIDISQLRSRKFTPEDLRKFDWVFQCVMRQTRIPQVRRESLTGFKC
jgi:protein-tyrosine-phosphatase